MKNTRNSNRHADRDVGARVLVIGGGFAGVAAAVALGRGGASVTVLDDRPTLGGRARSDVLAGITIDTGAQLITTAFARTLRLVGARGAPHESSPGDGGAAHAPSPPLRRVAGRDAYLRDGERIPLQFGSLRSLLGFRGLGAGEKMRLASSLLPALAAHGAALDADAARVPASLDHDSARTFVATRVSDHAADVLVEPPLNGFYAAGGRETSLAFYLMLGRYASEGDVLAPSVGWSGALEAALRGARYERGVRVSALELRGDQIAAHGVDGRAWAADGVVIATGPRSAHALLAPHLGLQSELLHWLAAVELRPTWTVALALDVTPRRDAFGIFRDARAARLVSACAVHGAKAADLPQDHDVLLAWPTPEGVRTLGARPTEHIVGAMLPEIEALVPEARGHVTRARVYRFDEGTPLAHPGFAADRVRGRALAESLSLPVALAGDYLAAPLIEGAVASGERAAALLATRLSPHRLAGDSRAPLT